MSFLNSYEYLIPDTGYLTGVGADTEFLSGTAFWNRYGRILYNASAGQLQYNASYTNGSARPKPVLRTTSQSRIENSQISWALGFFGVSWYEVPEPSLASFGNGSLFDVVIITEGGTENNTLASYDSCYEENEPAIEYEGDEDMFLQYVPLYIKDATARMNQYAPSGFSFNDNDTYAMQSICAYETAYIGTSSFCNLFTKEEWEGFEATLDIEYFYDYAYGNPTGRAQGVGYLQELLARLTDQYITSSNSSVNSSLDNNAKDFPLGRPFYADFSHDDIIISVLTAMSIDYFNDPVSLKQYPPNPDRHFFLNHLVPFGARLITEKIGCAAADPTAVHDYRTYYYPDQYGYSASNAPHKFIRMRLNNAVLPIDSIRGGKCAGRSDGLCPLENFLQAEWEAEKLANYQFACFANYTVTSTDNGRDWDGTVTNSTPGIVVHSGEITASSVP